MCSTYVGFVLIGKHGDTVHMGYSVITQPDPTKPDVFDEDGDEFPSLDAALRHHADQLVVVTPRQAGGILG